MNGTTQRFTARDDWRTSVLTRHMAALSTLGFRIVVEQVYDDPSGTALTVFHHSPRSLLPGRSGLPGAKALMQLFRSGGMERLDPLHPLLEALAGIENFLALERWRKEGIPCQLAADAIPAGAGPLAAQRTRLIAGSATQAQGETFAVRNAANAAAFARLGVPVHSITFTEGAPTYHLAQRSLALGQAKPFNVPALLGQFQNNELDGDHPFTLARQSVLNYLTLLRTCADAIQHTAIIWRNPNDRRSATLLASASSQARDIASRHLKG